MYRKLSLVLVTALLALTAACNSSSTSSTGGASAAGGGTVAATATASPGACPTTETKKFAKTEFVADAALAGGAFKRYIYSPAKAGKFRHGAKGKVVALIKAAAAGAFVINRLNAAKVNVENDPTLCKVLIAPLQSLSAAVSGLIGQARNGLGTISASAVDGGNTALADLHNAASAGGSAFTDNTSTSA
jgi:hypothetical protein